MSKKYTIGIDVDLTLVDPVLCVNGWFDTMWSLMIDFDDERYCKDLSKSSLDYNLSSYFTFPEGVDPFDYWRQEDLYDNLLPFPDAVKVIERLSKEYNILYISTCKGNHHKSKVEFLKRHFPAFDGFFATKEKHWIPVDIMIDDRVDILNKNMAPLKIQFDSPYSQREEPEDDVVLLKDWYNLLKVIEETKL